MKKTVLTIIIIATVVTSYGNQLLAQVSYKDSLAKSNSIIFPPLTTLIDSAIKNNAAVRFRQQNIDAKDASLKSEKNYWTRNFGLMAESRYGTFDNYFYKTDGPSSDFYNSTNKQMNYMLGLYLKFPIVDMVDRKNQVKRATAELDQAKSLVEVQEQEIRQLVIRQYQDVLLKQRLVNIQSVALGNAKVNLDMVEKEFRNGQIPVSEFVRISDIVSRVETDYEKAKTEFITAKLILEDITGLSFSKTEKNK